jgi:Ca2+-binding EF-hand superfamily protein
MTGAVDSSLARAMEAQSQAIEAQSQALATQARLLQQICDLLDAQDSHWGVLERTVSSNVTSIDPDEVLDNHCVGEPIATFASAADATFSSTAGVECGTIHSYAATNTEITDNWGSDFDRGEDLFEPNRLRQHAMLDAVTADALEEFSSLSDTKTTISNRGPNFPKLVIADLVVDHLFTASIKGTPPKCLVKCLNVFSSSDGHHTRDDGPVFDTLGNDDLDGRHHLLGRRKQTAVAGDIDVRPDPAERAASVTLEPGVEAADAEDVEEPHPNVTVLHDVYEDTCGVHLVLELCSCGELFDRIKHLASDLHVPSIPPISTAALSVPEAAELELYGITDDLPEFVKSMTISTVGRHDLSSEELDNLQIHFARIGADGENATLAKFEQVLKAMKLEALGPLAPRVFDLFDNNRDGTVDMRDVLCGLSSLRNFHGDGALQLCSQMYNVDRFGCINKDELASMLRALLEKYLPGEIAEHGKLDQVFDDMLTKGDVAPGVFVQIAVLDDHLVDVLLDAAVPGWNIVQREGISIFHHACSGTHNQKALCSEMFSQVTEEEPRLWELNVETDAYTMDFLNEHWKIYECNFLKSWNLGTLTTLCWKSPWPPPNSLQSLHAGVGLGSIACLWGFRGLNFYGSTLHGLVSAKAYETTIHGASDETNIGIIRVVFRDERIMVCQIVVRMKESVPPSVITMNTIVGGLCRAGRVCDALEFLLEKRIVWPEAKGNTVTYSPLKLRDTQDVQLFQFIDGGAPFDFSKTPEEAARVGQPWPSPIQFERQDIRSPIDMFRSLMNEKAKGDESELDDIHVAVREGTCSRVTRVAATRPEPLPRPCLEAEQHMPDRPSHVTSSTMKRTTLSVAWGQAAT